MLGFSILASAALKGTAVLIAAGLAAWMLRRRSAAARHLVWTAAAAALLALPILSLTLPALRVPARSNGPLAVFQVFSSQRTAPSPRLAAPADTFASRAGAAAREIDFRTGTTVVWAIGASFFLLQIVFACFALRRLRRGARPLDAAEVPQELGILHPVDVLEAARPGMPMTFGVLRPTVLLPDGASQWRPDRLRVVLLHELAHVRRGDVATHLLARTALALYWWNPLAWFAWREFLKERERATDDLVLHAGERASDYAGHLLEVARTLQPAPATAWAAIAMARRSQLEGRLIAILDSGVARKPSGRGAPAAAAVLAAALIAPFAAVQAQDPTIPPEADATIRAANSQKNHELLDRAAAGYEKLFKFDVAQKLLENSLAIREQVSGPGSAAYVAGLVRLGDLAAKRRQTADAVAFYSKAVSFGDRPEVSPALLYLGIRAFDASDRAAAQSYFERVLNVESKGPNAGRALTWLAILRQGTRGGDAEAELFYQRALAAVEPKSAEAATALTNYARLLRGQKRIDEAEKLDAQAAAVTVGIRGNLSAGSSPGVLRVGNGVSAPSLLHKVEPVYTEEARKAKIAGTVLLYIEVGPDGVARNIRVMRSVEPGLDEKAIEALQQWKFNPGMKDGNPVTVAATVEVNFRLL
jgi:TonB family protein